MTRESIALCRISRPSRVEGIFNASKTARVLPAAIVVRLLRENPGLVELPLAAVLVIITVITPVRILVLPSLLVVGLLPPPFAWYLPSPRCWVLVESASGFLGAAGGALAALACSI